MMKKLLLFIGIYFFFLIGPVNALSDINLDTTLNVSDVVDISSYDSGYVLLKKNGEVTKYDKDHNLITSKSFDGFKGIGIIHYNDSFIVYGVSDNLLNVYILDSNLRSVHNSSLDIMMNDSIVNSYIYDNKVYLILSLDGIISSTKMVVIDSVFNISIVNVSDITNLKDIIGSDYYLFNNEDSEIFYNSSASLDGNNYLVGYRLEDNKGILKNIETGNVLDNDYSNIDILSMGGYLFVLGKSDSTNKVMVYDNDGNLLSNIDLDSDVFKLDRLFNKLVIIGNNKLYLYEVSLDIKKDEGLFGTIQISGNSIPYSEVLLNVIPNSGYEVKNIVVRTRSGSNVKVVNGMFVMPEDSVMINIEYEETVKNPDTFDGIVWIGILSIVLLIVGRQLYVKYKWLS